MDNDMRHAKLLDCTLRDGAYIVDKYFGRETIHGLIEGLVKAELDFVEIGFFQDEGFSEGKPVFRNSEEAAQYIPDGERTTMFTVLADCSRYSIENLDERRGDSIDAIRECFFKKERFEAMENCRIMKEKGYLVFVQVVDILGYTDMELLDLIQRVNEVEPYCFSIVDTFGSMYQEDLHRVFEIVNNNLIGSCRIGFHSHNNMQLSNALSQEFLRLSFGRREVIVDGTLSGMGRGAGNTPTELIAQYMVAKMGYSYDMDAILDTIDGYMDNLRSRCEWGYSIPYFVAGCFGAHVNNIAYLTKKNSIRSKDIRFILNKIGAKARKRYNYDLLEETYVDLISSDIDDTEDLSRIGGRLNGRNVLILVPGKTATSEVELIQEYVDANNPVVISVNFIHEKITSDFVYMSNVRRYQYWKGNSKFAETKKIITSNIADSPDGRFYKVSFNKLIKCGWEHMDNSAIMLLRLIDQFDIREIAIAGFDGYNRLESNYASEEFELHSINDESIILNREISEMLTDYANTRNNKTAEIRFITKSRFSGCVI